MDFIKARKMVALDELAAEFGLRTAEAVKRVQALEAEGAITGVMDDRGKVGGGVRGLPLAWCKALWRAAAVGRAACQLLAAGRRWLLCAVLLLPPSRTRFTRTSPPPLPPSLAQFIYVSLEEMGAVADFIRQRGRIAIAELAAKSNQFIDLEAKAAAGQGEAGLHLPPEAVAAA